MGAGGCVCECGRACVSSYFSVASDVVVVVCLRAVFESVSASIDVLVHMRMIIFTCLFVMFATVTLRW